jgi:hypothetical protein
MKKKIPKPASHGPFAPGSGECSKTHATSTCPRARPAQKNPPLLKAAGCGTNHQLKKTTGKRKTL